MIHSGSVLERVQELNQRIPLGNREGLITVPGRSAFTVMATNGGIEIGCFDPGHQVGAIRSSGGVRVADHLYGDGS